MGLKKYTTRNFIIILAFGFSSVFPQTNPPYPRLGIFTFSGNSTACVEILKDFDIIAYPPGNTQAQRYKQQNPNKILLGTSGCLIAWDMGALPEGWYYHRSDGSRIVLWQGAYLMNVTEHCPYIDLGDGYGPKRFIDHAVLDVETKINFDYYDGVFHDWWWAGPGTDAKYNGDVNNNGVKDINEMGADSIQVLWGKGLKEFHQMEYDIPGLNYVVIQIGSTGDIWSQVHGACFEDWPIYNGPWSHWRNHYNDDQTPVKEPRLMLFNGSFSHYYANFPVTPYKNNYKAMRFGFSSCLLTSAYFYVDEGNQIAHHGNVHIYDEFEAKGRLGYPLADMAQLSGKPLASTPYASGVWVRFFDNGVSVVNATGRTQTISASELAAWDPTPGSQYFRFLGGQDFQINNGEEVTDGNPLSLWGDTHMANWAEPEVFGDGAMLFRYPDTLVTPIVVDNHENNQTSPGSNPANYVGSWTLTSDGKQHYAVYTGRDYGPFQPDGFAWASAGSGESMAIYIPTIGLPGQYEIYEWHGHRGSSPTSYTLASNAPARILHGCGDTTVTVNQRENFGQWNSLGRYCFGAGTSGRVELRNAANGIVISDAFQFVYRRPLTPEEEEQIGSEITLSFMDITSSKLGDTGTGVHGSAFADITEDNLPDLYITCYKAYDKPDFFFRNAEPVYVSEGSGRGIDDRDGGSQCASFADFDNDGDFDLINGTTVMRNTSSQVIGSDHNDIFENTGNGYFVDKTAAIPDLLNTLKKTRATVAFDMENDGDLDVFTVSGYLGTDDNDTGYPNEVYRNSGSFNFEALSSAQCGDLLNAPAGQGATDTDYDNDGDVDIIACNQTGDLNILNNNGSGVFTLITPSSIGIYHQAGVGVTMGDVDNDGDLDMLLVSEAPSSEAHLYLNNGNGTFGPGSAQDWNEINGYMGGFGDIDNDGDLDLIFAGYAYCYINDGSGAFSLGPLIQYDYPNISDPRSIAFADIDNDGDLDFTVADKGTKSRLIRNDLINANHFLKIKLTAPNGQAGAFGAKVRVYPKGQLDGPLLGFREARSLTGHCAQNDPVLHFGLGENAQVEVVVEFLDGTRIIHTDVDANSVLSIYANTEFALQKLSIE